MPADAHLQLADLVAAASVRPLPPLDKPDGGQARPGSRREVKQRQKRHCGCDRPHFHWIAVALVRGYIPPASPGLEWTMAAAPSLPASFCMAWTSWDSMAQ